MDIIVVAVVVVIVALVAFLAGYWLGGNIGFTWGYGFGRVIEFLHGERGRL